MFRQMEKLIELLNEYEPRIAGDGEHYDNIWWFRHCMSDKTVANNATRYIVSKEYGFIKWLVDNDKIDRVEVWSEGKTKPTYGYTTEPYTTCKSIELENTILMVLAIQDEPIEFLVSILK